MVLWELTAGNDLFQTKKLHPKEVMLSVNDLLFSGGVWPRLAVVFLTSNHPQPFFERRACASKFGPRGAGWVTLPRVHRDESGVDERGLADQVKV